MSNKILSVQWNEMKMILKENNLMKKMKRKWEKKGREKVAMKTPGQ